MYSKYLKVCRKASEDNKIFSYFRRNPEYRVVLEHVGQQTGAEYLHETAPHLLDHLKKFSTSEQYGAPLTFPYTNTSVFLSPTTCRYIKVLSDLIKYFGSLELNIVEIGCGYGGQCKIVYDLFKPKSYTLIDFPEVLNLSKKWLENFQVIPILRSLADISQNKYDLCISNYAFTEFTRRYQDFYAKHILKNSTMGYITCNFLNRKDAFSVKEIIDLMNGKMYEEKPKTGNNNAIYVWDHR